MEISIISEGVTDQIIIEAIIQKRLNDKDIILNPLQPKKGEPGGWPLVIEYCKSNDFKESLPYNDGLIIIHIDCDVLKGADIPKDCVIQFNGLDIKGTFEIVKDKIIEFITLEVFELCSEKVIFAIAIDHIECWLLPIYFPTKTAICNKTSGCITKLNPVLTKEHGFYIAAKDEDNYRTIAKKFNEKKSFENCYKNNESFALFIDSLNLAIDAYNKNNSESEEDI
ncbi:hypothetical protein ABS768_16780 [Flavobacterium sp. ST-75]|uniref:DUF4276 family protein n=1 Tax=Flavobacterium rhizophilum TaxID=3163296 RepID=A0ABW8YFZ0_9FLAO